MQFTKPITELIHQRLSCRTYQKKAITREDLSALKRFAESNNIGPLNNTIRVKITAATEEDSQQIKGLGTYGFIQDPAGFIIGAIKENPGSLLDFGYQLEKIILKATEIGIGSCWLGGTFTKSRFSALMDLQPGEDIPSVISIGYPSDQHAFMDRVSRIYSGADRRLRWEEIFFNESFYTPLGPGSAGAFNEMLEMVRLAPSASNKQPWRIIRDNGAWHFYIQRTRRYPPSAFKLLLNSADLQMVDLGIAMAHFELTANKNQVPGMWIIQDPGISMPDKLIEYCISWQNM